MSLLNFKESRRRTVGEKSFIYKKERKIVQKINFASLQLYKQYKNTVEGNEDVSRKQATLKMYRNMQLAHKSERSNGSCHYKYGCLHFIVVKNKIVWMQNGCKPQKGWKLDRKLYLTLNKELGIESDETRFSLFIRDFKSNLRYNVRKLKWKLKLMWE